MSRSKASPSNADKVSDGNVTKAGIKHASIGVSRFSAVKSGHSYLYLQQTLGNQGVSQLMRGDGHPLDPKTRAFMEEKFDENFSSVRIHNNSIAADSAKVLKAKAYTVGNDIVFGAGKFSPNSIEGKKLLAHELAHTVQQSRSGSVLAQPNSNSNYLENDADRAAALAIESNNSIVVSGSSPVGISRQPLDNDQTVSDKDISNRNERQQTESPITLSELALAMDDFEFDYELDVYVGRFKGNEHYINYYQYEELRSKVSALIFSEIYNARKTANITSTIYQSTQEVNQNHYFSSLFITKYYGISDPGEELLTKLSGAHYYANLSEDALMANDFNVAYELIELAKHEVRNAGYELENYRDKLISKSITVMEYATVVRQYSVNALIGTGAVIVTPAAIAGLGLVGGGIAVVGGGTLLGGYIEGGVNVVDQAMEGDSFDVEEFTDKAGGGSKRGLISSSAGFAGGAVAGMFSPETSVLLSAPVSGGAAGTTGRGMGAIVEGKSVSEIFNEALWGGVEGVIGGLISGMTTRYISMHDLSLASRAVIGGAGNMIAGAVSAEITGRSNKEIAESALMGLVFGVVEGIDTIPMTNTLQVRESVTGINKERSPWEYYGEDLDYGIIFAKSGEDIVGVHPDYPYTIFLPQGVDMPRVFTGQPGGVVTEIPWPFIKRLVADSNSPDTTTKVTTTSASQNSTRPEGAMRSEQIITPQASITTRPQTQKKVITPRTNEKKANVKPPKQTKQPVLTNVPEPIEVKESSVKHSTKKSDSGESLKNTPGAKKDVGKDTKEKARKSPKAKEPVKALHGGKGEKVKSKPSQSAARSASPDAQQDFSGRTDGILHEEPPILIYASKRAQRRARTRELINSEVEQIFNQPNNSNVTIRELRAIQSELRLGRLDRARTQLDTLRDRLDNPQPEEETVPVGIRLERLDQGIIDAILRENPGIQLDEFGYPIDWRTRFNQIYHREFLHVLHEFRGNWDVSFSTSFSGGEGQLFLSALNPGRTLKRHYPGRRNIRRGVDNLVDAYEIISNHDKLSQYFRVVQIHDRPDHLEWIIRDFSRNSIPISEAIKNNQKALQRYNLASDVLGNQVLYGGYSNLSTMRERFIRMRDEGDNFHYVDEHDGYFLWIDGQ